MHKTVTRSGVAVLATLSLVLAGCGSDDDGATVDDVDSTITTTASDDDDADGADDAGSAPAQVDADDAAEDVPTIVVTTNILGDVVEEVVGDAADVVTIMPVGADPHDFQASAQEVDTLMNADALIVNGAAFEEGLLDVIESAEDEGVSTFEAMSVVDAIEFGEGGHDHDEDHGDEDHDGDDHSGDDHSGDDPHFFTDPMRMAAAVEGIVAFLEVELDGIDTAALAASADAYLAELTALDAEVDERLDAIADERRVLVTNHEVFGYFADRYEFEIVGVVIPGGGTTDSVSAGELAELAETIEAEGVPAIFSDTSSSDELVQTLAGEVGDIEVVALYTESLGDADSDGATYLDMVRTNSERITAALA